jgi:carbon storage regulator
MQGLSAFVAKLLPRKIPLTATKDRSQLSPIQLVPITPPIYLIAENVMLVLSRHRDESIMIGDDVVVTIVDIRGDKVRLGIEAPQSIPVHRQEVYEAIQRENRNATQTGSTVNKKLGTDK